MCLIEFKKISLDTWKSKKILKVNNQSKKKLLAKIGECPFASLAEI